MLKALGSVCVLIGLQTSLTGDVDNDKEDALTLYVRCKALPTNVDGIIILAHIANIYAFRVYGRIMAIPQDLTLLHEMYKISDIPSLINR